MEFNDQQCPMPANSSRASNSEQRASTPEEVVTQDDSYRPNNQVLSSYHRIFPEGDRYVRVAHSPGFHFCPEDDELIVDFLNKEINKERAEYIHVPKVNVYKHSPEELARYQQIMVKDEWYFFSPRDRKYANGTRPNRAAGNGYWKATGADKKICRDGVCVGFKKCLVFYEGPAQNGEKTDWIMHEYVSDLQPPRERQGADDMRLDDCVLCRIYKKSEQTPKTEKESTAAATECGETAKSAAHKSSNNKNQAAPKRVKPENHDTNNLPGPQNVQVQQPQPQQMNTQLLQTMIEYLQVRQLNPLTPHQINLPVQHPNPQTPYQINLPVQQHDPNPQMLHQINFPVHPQMPHQINLTVQQPNPPTQHRYIPVRHPNPHEMLHQINLPAVQQLNPPMPHQYLAMPHPNPPTVHQNPPVPHPNPLTMHQNLEAIPIQYDILAGSRDQNLGGVMIDGNLGSASEDTGQAQAGIIQNRHGTNFTDFPLRDMIRILTPPQIYPNGFPSPPETHDQTFNSSSTDSFNPDSLLRNNDQTDSD